MSSTDLAAAILRLYSDRPNLPVTDLYQTFPTVDRTHLGSMVHELAETGLLLADVWRNETIDGPATLINSISRTSLVGEAWLSQLADEPLPTVH